MSLQEDKEVYKAITLYIIALYLLGHAVKMLQDAQYREGYNDGLDSGLIIARLEQHDNTVADVHGKS